ncbi:acyl-[acyl-carrier-protein]-UDP-N-acetylglucosamine O-acyltransferase, variant 1 [Aphanomyces astaci]|uniref:Acyl-[acyl-carrier-protein]-UDP-N-acetylglucosamine O-acyltransferase, variant 1 n=1 Tax=Aphanomyces astaci TaxID=112090 RepID=W4H6W8_APHAT|nr:acyl-[acyl-carrier-protein]-UDP-N-acetylglucosamine O-acyltransferase, variant 1 [Aphanomyces astaci]ETV86863.1 acyl-[acyl-carrier-protein]-UDP-N-acetylglucosamine O-acyltransferase, variant 1 [Aphanomyces astaci]|eukprot:XP_009823663.1 acyl-[acyl-carrier-protein]-UDP-N-acetylglucosamine O-acyltransferase, variant 1 [Aphanomyces astaci]
MAISLPSIGQLDLAFDMYRKWRLPIMGARRRHLSSSPSAQHMEPMRDYLDHISVASQHPSSHFLAQPRSALSIHPTAVVHPDARLGDGVQIGPYCVVGPDVSLHANVVLKSHVVIEGVTTIGENTTLFPFGCIGGPPQDKKHVVGEHSALVIGKNCLIREHVTINCGTSLDAGTTRVGDACWILAGVHIGHDSQVGTRVVLSNNVCLAGHVTIHDLAIVGGQVGIKQFVHIGRLAMIGGKSAVDGDVLPFGLACGNRAKLVGLNLIGLRRLQASRTHVKEMLQAYRYIYNVQGNHFAPPLPSVDYTYEIALYSISRLGWHGMTLDWLEPRRPRRRRATMLCCTI